MPWRAAFYHTTSLEVCRQPSHSANDLFTDIISTVVEILIIISFFFILSLAEWASAKIIRAGIIGHIAVGIIYGKPLADILEADWQKTFLSLGYVGLILIIFEGMST